MSSCLCLCRGCGCGYGLLGRLLYTPLARTPDQCPHAHPRAHPHPHHTHTHTHTHTHPCCRRHLPYRQQLGGGIHGAQTAADMHILLVSKISIGCVRCRGPQGIWQYACPSGLRCEWETCFRCSVYMVKLVVRTSVGLCTKR